MDPAGVQLLWKSKAEYLHEALSLRGLRLRMGAGMTEGRVSFTC